jgi:uncharacterized protein (TIGR00369 family)
MNLRFETDGQIVKTHFVPRMEHVGFRQTMHGGLVSTLLDEMMAWAVAVAARKFAYCAELNVRFLRPVRPKSQITAIGEVIANRRGKILEARAELRDEKGAVLATGTGKYLPVKSDATELAADLVADPKWGFSALGVSTVADLTA